MSGGHVEIQGGREAGQKTHRLQVNQVPCQIGMDTLGVHMVAQSAQKEPKA